MLKLDVNFFKPFIDGTLHTLKVQCSLEAKPGKPFMKGKGPSIDCEIAAVIGLTSTAFSGTIALCFTKPVFLALMNNMLGEKFEEITDDLQDGAAELLNIIFGHAKRVLNDQKSYDIQKAIPTILRGKNIQTKHLTSGFSIVLPFLTDAGEFHIEICTENKTL